jgi:large subunit ribosomal protein L9
LWIKRKVMKVVFLQNVPRVARVGEVKEVADGYGRNFLIPSKMALPASVEAINKLGSQLAIQARNQAETEAELLEMAKNLDGREVILEARIGSKDRLYGSITAADIAVELESVTGFAVDKRKVEMEESIRQVGSYEVTVRLAKDIAPQIKVTVSGKAD